MNNDRGKRVMNLSESRHSSSESMPPLQIHNFMPMSSPSSVHAGQDLSESEKHAYFMNQLEQNMQIFWRERLSEIQEAANDVRTPHSLPLARIKKVMKSDEKVKMISADTPVLFAKACEIFVMELTLRAWMHTREDRRRTVQRNDVAYAIRDEPLLAFLNDMVPLESHHHHQQVDDLANPDHGGVYVPLPVRGVPVMPPNNPMYLHGMNVEQEVAPARGRPTAGDDHHSTFPMNLPDNVNPAFFSTISGGMQQNPSFPPPSTSDDDDANNPYLIFKQFFP